MKMKSFAMLAMASLMATAAIAYNAGVVADDMNGDASQPTQIAPPPDAGLPSSQSQNSSMQNQPSMGENMNAGSDEASPDTTTGDDDY